MNTRAELTGCD